MIGLPSTTLLVDKYEVGEPRLLGHGRYGPHLHSDACRQQYHNIAKKHKG